ncbi:hypothetical protein ACJD0Z_14410 [Flavobacteriaceae bacterium M23B6Z8]
MRIHELLEFLNGDEKENTFFSELKEEVLSYTKQKQGQTSDIFIQDYETDLNIEFTSTHLRKLLSLYLNEKINKDELEYVMNVVDFSDLSYSKRIADIIFALSTPELHQNPYEKKNITNFMKSLDDDNCIS